GSGGTGSGGTGSGGTGSGGTGSGGTGSGGTGSGGTGSGGTGSGGTGSGGTGSGGTATGGTPTTDQELCERAAGLAGYLDQWQTAGDGRVYYCHSSSGNYTFVESDISSCLPHLNHNFDVFPSTGCDT
ncbi:MAG: hypothetical protein KC621_25685, partial [Myxococcales bacterium]|nr:hypothetical protein [Myxococcales bacterium]